MIWLVHTYITEEETGCNDWEEGSSAPCTNFQTRTQQYVTVYVSAPHQRGSDTQHSCRSCRGLKSHPTASDTYTCIEQCLESRWAAIPSVIRKRFHHVYIWWVFDAEFHWQLCSEKFALGSQLSPSGKEHTFEYSPRIVVDSVFLRKFIFKTSQWHVTAVI